jgi:hypothetical protein
MSKSFPVARVGWLPRSSIQPLRILDAAKNRFSGIVTDLDLDIPEELAQ